MEDGWWPFQCPRSLNLRIPRGFNSRLGPSGSGSFWPPSSALGRYSGIDLSILLQRVCRYLETALWRGDRRQTDMGGDPTYGAAQPDHLGFPDARLRGQCCRAGRFLPGGTAPLCPAVKKRESLGRGIWQQKNPLVAETGQGEVPWSRKTICQESLGQPPGKPLVCARTSLRRE